MKVGDCVMLSETAPKDLQVAIGSEAVLTVITQVAGEVVGTQHFPKFICRHEHRGRLTFDHVEGGAIDGRFLQVISKESACGQRLIHNAMTEDFANMIFSGPIPQPEEQEEL